MDDLIKRSDAIEAIEEVDWWHQNRNKDMVSGANSAEHQAWYKADDVYKALEEVPSADRPQGEWKGYNADKGGDWLRNDGTPVFLVCDKCYGTVINNGSAHWNYCPYCGSRNREENDR